MANNKFRAVAGSVFTNIPGTPICSAEKTGGRRSHSATAVPTRRGHRELPCFSACSWPQSFPPALVVRALSIFLLWRYRGAFAGLLRAHVTRPRILLIPVPPRFQTNAARGIFGPRRPYGSQQVTR